VINWYFSSIFLH